MPAPRAFNTNALCHSLPKCRSYGAEQNNQILFGIFANFSTFSQGKLRLDLLHFPLLKERIGEVIFTAILV